MFGQDLEYVSKYILGPEGSAVRLGFYKCNCVSYEELMQLWLLCYFQITPFLALRRCNIVNFNPMAHGTKNATKSAHYPVMYLCSRRLCLTRLQVVSKIVDLKSITS
jgi:hypothetical protein